MAGKIFFSVSMSLDGFSAPESMAGLLATPEQRDIVRDTFERTGASIMGGIRRLVSAA